MTTETRPDDWNSHWQRYGAVARRNPAQSFRRMLIHGALSELAGRDRAGEGMRILDVGCGVGDLARELVERYPRAEVVGIDLSEAGVRAASEHVPGARFYQQNLLEELRLPDAIRGWATHAICSEVLEHLDDPTRLLRNLGPLLAQGASLIVTVPGGPRSAFDIHIGHRQHYSAEKLGSLLRSSGFEPEAVEAAGFPFFNLYKLSVIARGKKLIDEVIADGANASAPNKIADLAIYGFDKLFRFNATKGRHGWQLLGVARYR